MEGVEAGRWRGENLPEDVGALGEVRVSKTPIVASLAVLILIVTGISAALMTMHLPPKRAGGFIDSSYDDFSSGGAGISRAFDRYSEEKRKVVRQLFEQITQLSEDSLWMLKAGGACVFPDVLDCDDIPDEEAGRYVDMALERINRRSSHRAVQEAQRSAGAAETANVIAVGSAVAAGLAMLGTWVTVHVMRQQQRQAQ
jgi:hypothetical protein